MDAIIDSLNCYLSRFWDKTKEVLTYISLRKNIIEIAGESCIFNSG